MGKAETGAGVVAASEDCLVAELADVRDSSGFVIQMEANRRPVRRQFLRRPVRWVMASGPAAYHMASGTLIVWPGDCGCSRAKVT